MRNSTIPPTSLRQSITLESLNDTYREPRPPLDNPYELILSLTRISANDRQSAEFESNSEVKFPPPLRMKISTVTHRLYKNDSGCIQNDNHFALRRRLYQ